MAYKESGAMGGAIQGAQVGSMIMPGVGTAVGAVLGAVGGYLSGSAADKAARYQRQAQKRERAMSMRTAWVERRDMIRQGRIAQAQQIAAIAATGEGGLQSSAPRGAMASTTAQFGFNQSYFAKRIADFNYIQMKMRKAARAAGQASDIQGYMKMASSAASMFAPSPVTPSQLPSKGYGTGEAYGRNATTNVDPATGFAYEG